jgi:hypothetical protein
MHKKVEGNFYQEFIVSLNVVLFLAGFRPPDLIVPGSATHLPAVPVYRFDAAWGDGRFRPVAAHSFSRILSRFGFAERSDAVIGPEDGLAAANDPVRKP